MQSEQTIACLLTSGELQKRKEGAIRQVHRFVTAVTQLERGYRLAMKDEAGAIEAAAALLRLEHDCCPFLDFQFTVPAVGGELCLDVTGPEEAHEIIRDAFVGASPMPGATA